MKTFKFALLAATAIALTSPAYAADTTKVDVKHSVKSDTDGNIKETYAKTKVDAAGTKTESKVEAKVDVDKDGDAEKTIETVESTDPKGLMNKTKTKTKEVVKNHNGQIEKSTKKIVDGKTVEDTTVKSSASVNAHAE